MLRFLVRKAAAEDLLKAVVKKRVWVAGYTTKGGTYVRPHQATVNMSTDHDDRQVASGQGKKLEQKAHAILSKQASHNALSTKDKASNIVHLATKMQKEATASAQVSLFKKAILAGKKPNASQIKAVLDLSADKYDKLVKELSAAGKASLAADVISAYKQADTGKPEKAENQATKQPSPGKAVDDQLLDAGFKKSKTLGIWSQTVRHGNQTSRFVVSPDKNSGKYTLYGGVMKDDDGGAMKSIGQYSSINDAVAAFHDKKNKLLDSVSGSNGAAVESSGAQIKLDNDALESLNIDGLKLPESNSNSKTFNKKVDALKSAVHAGDIDAIYNLSYSSNGYGEKLRLRAIKSLLMFVGTSSAAAKSVDEKTALLNKVLRPGHSLSSGFHQYSFGDGDDYSVKEGKWVSETDEGDTKPGAKGTLTFHNGRWRYMNKEVGAEPVATKKTEPVAKTGSQNQNPPPGKASMDDVLQALDAVKLPESNTNHKTVNKKIDALHAAVLANDIDAIQAMKFGSNTYGKKLEKVAGMFVEHLQGAPGKTDSSSSGGKASTDEALVSGWHLSIVSGQQPTNAQHAAYLKLPPLEKDKIQSKLGNTPDKAQQVFDLMHAANKSYDAEHGKGAAMELASSSLPVDPVNDADDDIKPVGSKDGWEFSANDPGFSNADSVTSSTPDGNISFYIAQDSESGTWQAGVIDIDDGPDFEIFESPVDAAKHLAKITVDYGMAPPPTAVLANLHPDLGALKQELVGRVHYGESIFVKNKDGEWQNSDTGHVPAKGGWKSLALDLLSGAEIDPSKYTKEKKDTALDIIANPEFGHGKADVAAALNAVYPAGAKNSDGDDVGPKEGDTKVINGVTYVLHNGRWHKQGEDVDGANQAPVEPIKSAWGDSYTYKEGNSNKFWSAFVAGNQLITHYGKIGTKGSVTVKQFASNAEAEAAKKKVVKTKEAKGYLFDATEPMAPHVAKKLNLNSQVQSPGTTEDASGWKKVGAQQGSNAGGWYQDDDGKTWYIKTPTSASVANNEVLAAKLYAAAGIKVPDVKLVMLNGKHSIASQKIDGLQQSRGKLEDNAAKGVKGDVGIGFAVDAWLGNWDSVGTGYDNMQSDTSGHVYRVDLGGSMLYRAQGAEKGSDFGDAVTELKTMRDKSKNPYAASIFSGLSDEAVKQSASATVLKLSDAKITELCKQFGPGSETQRLALAKKLINRRNDMAKQLDLKVSPATPVSAKKKPAFNPSLLSTPPSFMSWGTSGKPGPSSKAFINEANHAAASAIYETAKSGDIEQIKALRFPVMNKDTGAVTGKVPALDHPSQWIRGYAQQMINEIDEQRHPPKAFRWVEGNPLHAIDSAYPTSHVANAVEKVGYFLHLGTPGVVSDADAGITSYKKYTTKTLISSTYSKIAKSVIPKIPKHQADALKSYTGAGYKAINKSLWSGNPSGAAKSAGEALHALGHDLHVGTVLSRRLDLNPDDLEKLKKSVGSVLQEPAVVSTSIDPGVWDGNVHLKLKVGPGVKGLYVGPGSDPNGDAFSNHGSEKEVLLPPNTRMLIQAIKPSGKGDEDGFGGGSSWIVEAIVLPTMK